MKMTTQIATNSHSNTLRIMVLNFLGLLIGLAGLPVAQADSVTVNVKGTITAPTCAATPPPTLTLDQLILGSAGTTGIISSSTKPFTVTVNCTGNIGVNMVPTGNSWTYGVYTNSGTATNVDVYIACKNSSGVYVDMSNTGSYSYNFASGANTIACQASYYNKGNPKAGSVNAVMTLSFSYG